MKKRIMTRNGTYHWKKNIAIGIMFLLIWASFVPVIKGTTENLNTVDNSSVLKTTSVQKTHFSPDANQSINTTSALRSENHGQIDRTSRSSSPERKNQIEQNPDAELPVELYQNETFYPEIIAPIVEQDGVLSSAITTPFRINNNTQMITMAVSNSWVGTGSVDNPYILDNINIDAGGTGYAIFIGNTTLHFILRNASLRDADFVSDPYYSGSVIILYNVSNAKVLSNSISYTHHSPGLHNGISILSSDNVTIGHNTIYYFHHYGIQVTSSTDVTIENNSIRSNSYGPRGINLLTSSGNTIANNTFNYNMNEGSIYLLSSNENMIVNNHISNYYYGIYVKSSIENNISANSIAVSYYKGVTLDHSNNTMVYQNTFSGYYGVHIITSNNNTVELNTYSSVTYANWIQSSSVDIFFKNNTLNYCSYGIKPESSSRLSISNNTMTGGYYSIYLQSTGNCLIEKNTISDTDGAGIYLYNSVNNILLSNNLTRSSIGIYPTFADYTQQTIPTSNTVNGRPVYYYKSANESDVDVPLNAGQVIVGGATNLHIYNLNLSDQNYALTIGFSTDILIENNTFEQNSDYSIFSYSSDDNVYRNNTFNDSEYGLQLSFCDNNELVNNTITGDDYGIYLDQSNTVSLENNTITQTLYYGVGLYYSTNCNFQNNTFLQSSIDINGNDGTHFSSQTIPTTNTVNSRPVYYYANVNLDNDSIPPVDAGEVILGNVVYANVSDQNLSDQNVGLLIGYSSNITVFNNTLDSNSPYGMKIYGTTDSEIDQNQITDCEMGVYLGESDRNILINNNVTECDEGFSFEYSDECNITDNHMAANNYCINLYDLTNNNISGNMFNDSDIGVYLNYNTNSNIFFNNTFDEIYDEGIFVYYSDSNQLLGNDFANTNVGIYLESSESNLLQNNFFNNTDQGILLDNSDSNQLLDNIFNNINEYGIYLYSSNTNQVQDNFFNNSDEAIYLEDSSADNVTGNDFENCGYGVYTKYVDTIILNANIFNNVDTGIYIYESDIQIYNNSFIACYESGIYIEYCNELDINNNTFNECTIGFTVEYSDFITIKDNTITNCSDTGIYYTDDCEDGLIETNNLTNCSYSIYIESCYYIVTQNNTIEAGNVGIEITDGDSDEGDYNTIQGNNIANTTEAGILLSDTYDNTLSSNVLIQCSISIEGDEDTFIDQTIETSNTVNGKPVYYYYDDEEISITSEDDPGQVILGSIGYSTIQNLTLSNQNIGLMAGYCYDITVEGAVFESNNFAGISLYKTTESNFQNNAFNLCENGIYQSDDGSDNLIQYNNFSNCSNAILMEESYGSIITENNITTSEDGIHLLYSEEMEVDYNVIGNCSEAGIHLEGYSDYDYDIFQYNQIENCTDGILLYQSEDMYIDYNYINGSDNAGIHSVESSYNTFSDNEIYNCSDGIQLVDSYEDTAEYNTIDHCFNGINVTGTSRGSNLYVTVEWNTINNSDNLGIKIVGSTETSVLYNLIQNSASYGILTNTSEQCTISLNRLIENNGANTEYDAEHVQASDDCYVYRDTVAPIFYEWWPADGYITTDEYIGPYWTLFEDESGPVSSSIRIDGGEWQEAYFDGGGHGYYDYYYEFDDLTEGIHLIDINGSDTAGNNVTISFNITVDFEYNGPLYDYWYPSNGIRTSDYIEPYWVVYSGEADIASSYIRIDGGEWQEAYFDGQDGAYYYYYYDFYDLAEGNHVIDINATDEADHYTMISITLIVDYDFGGEEMMLMSAGTLGVEEEPSDVGSTSWYSEGSGNYWSDWLMPDDNSDGYVDNAYQIAGGNATDQYPLAWMIGPPVDLSATPHPTNVELSWDGYNYSLTGSIDGYNLTRDPTAEDFPVPLGSDATYYNDENVTPYSHYNYTLVAYSGDILGCPSQLHVVTPDDYPPIVIITSPEDGSNTTIDSVEVTWVGYDNYTGVFYYSVSLNDGDGIDVGMNTSYIFTGLIENDYNELHVMVHANDWDTYEMYVTVYFNYSSSNIPPDSPSSFTATAVSTSQIDLGWTKGTNATHTRIQRKTGNYPINISDGTNVYNSTGSSTSNTGLDASTTYYYRAWSWNNTTRSWSTDNASAHDTTQSGGGGGTSSNQAPIAHAGGPYSGYVNHTISFSGSGSTDDTSVVGYRWDFTNDGIYDTGWLTTSTTTHTYSTAGTYTVNLQVKDGAGLTDTDTATVTITAASTQAYPPVAHAGGSYSGLTFQDITFVGSGSTDDGTIISYAWSFGDGTTGTGVTALHRYTTAGVFSVRLTVTDNDGFTNTSTTTATIALDSDGDGISDAVEEQLGSNPDNASGVVPLVIAGTSDYLVDTNGDGILDTFYNTQTGTHSTTKLQADGTYLIDVNGDGTWEYIYDPAFGTTTAYKKESPGGFPWPIVGIILAIIAIIVLVVVVLVKKRRL